MNKIFEAYQGIVTEASKLLFWGQEKPIKIKKKITITVEAELFKSKHVDPKTKEPVEGYLSAEVKYNVDKMEKEIKAALLPEFEKLLGEKIAKTGGSQHIGFPNYLSNAAYASGKWYK